MPTILLVCTANQIRSPLAQEFLKKLLADRGLADGYHVTSAGTWAADDQPAMPKAIEVGQEMGVDLRQHRSRMVTGRILEQADLVLTMENRQKEALAYEFPENKAKIYLLSEITGYAEDVSDPVLGGKKSYQSAGERIYQLLDEGLDEIIRLAS